jgi:hypothetical protein
VIDFRRYRDRLIVAAAVAIAFHEILLGLVHGPARPSDTEDTGVTTKIVFEAPRSPSPRPTPKPTPTPRPTPPPTPEPHRTPPPRSTPAAVKQIAARAKGKPARHHGGGARKVVAKTGTTGTYADPNAAGVGTSRATGVGTGPQPGAGGGQGGNGNGNQGNGNGAVNADTPCGFVDFKPTAAPRYSGTTASEPVEATVTFPDGHHESARFPYLWVYPDGEQTDPWSNTNLKNPNFGDITLRFPPAGADPSTYPPLIQYILKHTNSGGYTNLQPCPQSRG